jgi:hypothetical protein
MDNNEQQMAVAKARVAGLQAGMERAWFDLADKDRVLANLSSAGL